MFRQCSQRPASRLGDAGSHEVQPLDVTEVAPLSFRRSGLLRSQSRLNGFRIAIDDEKIGAGGTLRHTAALLPMAQGIDAEPETAGKLFLRHIQFGAYRPDVDFFGDVNAVSANVGFTLGVGHRLHKSAPDTFGDCARHFSLLA